MLERLEPKTLPRIRLVIVDDQTTIREALKVLLSLQPDFEIVGLASSGEEAISLVQSLQPDVVLVDIEMPGMSGIEVTEVLKEQVPNPKIVILSSHDSRDYLSRSFQSGAQGYLLKNTPPEDLAATIRLVQKGYSQISPGLMEKVLPPLPAPIASVSSNVESLDLTFEALEAEIESLQGAEASSSALIKRLKNQIQDLRNLSDKADRLAQSIQVLRQGFQTLQPLLSNFTT